MEISTKDLRSHSKELFNAIDRGEEVILTYHGKPRAKITGLPEGKKSGESTTSFGIWSERIDIANVEDHVRSLRKGRQF